MTGSPPLQRKDSEKEEKGSSPKRSGNRKNRFKKPQGRPEKNRSTQRERMKAVPCTTPTPRKGSCLSGLSLEKIYFKREEDRKGMLSNDKEKRVTNQREETFLSTQKTGTTLIGEKRKEAPALLGKHGGDHVLVNKEETIRGRRGRGYIPTKRRGDETT